MLSGRHHQQQSFNDSYTALILEVAEKLYNKLTIKLTNRVTATATATITADATAIRASPLPSIGNNNKQKLPHTNNTYDEREELRYNDNSQLGIYNNDKE
jgi:hypothetical protein